ncbi:MAG TPA: hypothetical protein PKD64_08230 [Pirellulaceae bacterium]|nr:hypothetical protein [Pirellulaceae bacterium]HMO92174.1 hypothetical protein [Pirellulaceae bacterium]HMP68899.1 hypothetical protein [Pirellulaceae bacterium]
MSTCNYQKLQRRRAANQAADATPGHDSFLDIVANLVGVLIILLVVVGTHAGTSLSATISQSASPVSVDLKELEQRLDRSRSRSVSLQLDAQRLDQLVAEEALAIESLTNSRQGLLIEIELAKSELANRMQQLEHSSFELVAALQIKHELDKELESAQAAYRLASNEVSKQVTQINHYPTPLAKTVFQDEVHVRIAKGLIEFVPVDELVEKMRGEWKLKAEKLKSSNHTTETVGPVGNFRLQYVLEAEEVSTPTDLGLISERRLTFRRFVILPTQDNLGEPVETAFQSGSRFRKQLSGLVPAKTTVSIWVYPDSYAEFNQVKTFLQRSGYQTAVWPLPMGRPISGGPDGYRSTAQ